MSILLSIVLFIFYVILGVLTAVVFMTALDDIAIKIVSLRVKCVKLLHFEIVTLERYAAAKKNDVDGFVVAPSKIVLKFLGWRIIPLVMFCTLIVIFVGIIEIVVFVTRWSWVIKIAERATNAAERVVDMIAGIRAK